MSVPQSWVENCIKKCGAHLKSVWMSIITPLRRAMNTLYCIPLPIHAYCSSSFGLLITNMTLGGGGGEISRGVGQGHVLRSRNLRCWKQRTQMPHRVVRSLIHSS